MWTAQDQDVWHFLGSGVLRSAVEGDGLILLYLFTVYIYVDDCFTVLLPTQ